MQQNALNSPFSVFCPTPKTLNIRELSFTGNYWVPHKQVLGGAFHSVIFGIPGNPPFQGWNSYSPLHMWEKWAERVSDMFPTAHLVSGAWSPKSTYNLLLFKTASWHDWLPGSTKNCHKNKSNFFYAPPGWLSNKSWMPELKQTAVNWSPLVGAGTWGQRCPAPGLYRAVNTAKPRGFKFPESSEN